MFIEFGGTLVNLKKIFKFAVCVDGDIYHEKYKDEYEINNKSEIYISAMDEDDNEMVNSNLYPDIATAQYELKKLHNEINAVLKSNE